MVARSTPDRKVGGSIPSRFMDRFVVLRTNAKFWAIVPCSNGCFPSSFNTEESRGIDSQTRVSRMINKRSTNLITHMITTITFKLQNDNTVDSM